MRICVYTRDQDHRCEAFTHEASRTLAASLIVEKLAKAINQHAIQLTTDESWKALKARVRTVAQPKSLYIPEVMPPKEIPGVWFQTPQSDTWKIQHAGVYSL